MKNKRFDRWLQLKDKLDEFEKRMPLYLKPLIFMPAAEEKDFPRIYYKDEKAAVTAINFRLAKLLLHAALRENLQVVDQSRVEIEMKNYPRNFTENLAREVAGIMASYDSDMRIWPINIHSLRQASQFVDSSSPCFKTLRNLTIRVISVCQTNSNIPDLLNEKENGPKAATTGTFVET
ncbi:hypothetical protein JCM33374_g3946 [Metschnikowia sp. JCM 33374]|nr:hypothetical protein JCM33374_g3946 [Metschnikowia sp. JCM 33374]